MNKDLQQKSKYISLLLRHKPEQANLTLDKEGWCEVKQLLQNTGISIEDLQDIVVLNDKQRFSFNDDRTKIRALQGHSISVDLKLKEKIPPTVLYHGTKRDDVKSILKKGLLKMHRNHVHLSADKATAERVAKRRNGHVAILKIDAKIMLAKEYKFFQSENQVWLTDFVPPQFIEVVDLL